MASKKDSVVANKLDQLSKLQEIHTKIDQIQILKGELPIEVADLEDEIAGLNTRHQKILRDIEDANEQISARNNTIKEANALITKYERQLDTVKNNREFDALSKEIELQKLDVKISEKKIKEATSNIDYSKSLLDDLKSKIDVQNDNLTGKNKELGHIVEETEKEEIELTKNSEELELVIDEKLLAAYKRIRKSYRNGLAVVHVERNACGGCFGKIPPQTQAEIKLKKKITTCEHCGRILTDVDEFDEDAEFIPASAMMD
jgi:predicted  nucleic acid-binding Zn-ribbon protein